MSRCAFRGLLGRIMLTGVFHSCIVELHMDTKERGSHERKKHWPVEFCGSPGWVDIAYCVFRHEAYPSRQYAFFGDLRSHLWAGCVFGSADRMERAQAQEHKKVTHG